MIRVALIGPGTVGTEVIAALRRRDPHPVAELVDVGIRDDQQRVRRRVPKALARPLDDGFVDPRRHDVLVELMGGIEPARSQILSALRHGVSVVTANKLLLARHGAELEDAARECGASLRFEAAVAGGTPVLGPLARDLVANHVVRIRGIVNGTTNYIVTWMAQAGTGREEALANAQRLGFAEADPGADLSGSDAVNKVVILVRLGFGSWLHPDHVVDRNPSSLGQGRPGIIGVSSAHVSAAEGLGFRLRLLAEASASAAGSISARATVVALGPSPLGRLDGVLNRVEIEGRPVGVVAFEGPGAGGAATSSAVLGDIAAIADGLGSTWSGQAPRSQAQGLPADWGRRPWLMTLSHLPNGVDWVDRSVPVLGGYGVLTRPLALNDVRGRLLEHFTGPTEVDFYPVIE